jgi:hypothetical protein
MRNHDTPPGETIRRAWNDASRQFTNDGILVIAGDFWVGGPDEYAAAATEILNARLPSDAWPAIAAGV